MPIVPLKQGGQEWQNPHRQAEHKCRDCGRQFVLNPTQKRISKETKGLIDKLLLEKLPLAGIARVADVSEPWLQEYVNGKYRAVARQAKVKAKKKTVDAGV